MSFSTDFSQGRQLILLVQQTPVEHDSPNIVALDTTGLTDRLANLASPFDDEEDEDEDLSQYTEEEIGCTNKSVKILPGVARIMSSIPQDRLAIATSGAKTHCHGALARAGIRTCKSHRLPCLSVMLKLLYLLNRAA